MGTKLPTVEEVSEMMKPFGYEYVRPIGSGSFGAVHLVRSYQYDSLFCAKVVLAPENSDGNITNYPEIDILIGLAHPNIIRVYNYFTVREFLFLILEFCPGGSLMDKLREEPLPISEVISISQKLLSALAFMHSRNVAHRDLKPANILIDAYDRVKLADFGLSIKNYEACTSSISGTLLLMAPEVIKMLPHDPFKADIWSMGITIYFLAAGQPPWTPMKVEQLKNVIINGMITYPQRFPPKLIQLLQSMLITEPTLRKSAAELLSYPVFRQIPLQPQIIRPVLPIILPKNRPGESKALRIPLMPAMTQRFKKRKAVSVLPSEKGKSAPLLLSTTRNNTMKPLH